MKWNETGINTFLKMLQKDKNHVDGVGFVCLITNCNIAHSVQL